MIDDNTADRHAGWYVSRVVNLQRADIRTLGLLGGVVTPGGATLRIGAAHAVDNALEDHQSYAGTLTFPGLVPVKVKVELVVTRYAPRLAEVGLRPMARVPQRRVSAERYFDAAWAVLDAIARTEGGAAPAVPERSVARTIRRAARAS